jgi:hypothetical protein
MKLHKRERITTTASLEFDTFMLDWEQKHKLTYTEVIQIVIGYVQRQLKYCLREERHPEDPSKPAGIE